MCGIAGKLNFQASRGVRTAEILRMTAVLRHRGPDDEGVWVDGPVGLGNRRLAIIDLSPRGRQPVTNEDGSLQLVFNGEIYNFQAIRDDLERKGHVFKSESDTEVVVHLYEEDGVRCVDRLRGMFAFALWDARRRTLFLARDRLGKKPLFYARTPETFLFASEPKAILQDPAVSAEPDSEAIHHYLTFGYVPAPYSAFKGIRKVLPAHYVVLQNEQLQSRRYWSLHYAPKMAAPESVLAEELLALLDEAVRLRLISDVPVGALLSGGLDSSAVVALMRRATSGTIRTFSIGFEEPEYDESGYARQVARRFETEHHEFVVKPSAVDVLPRLVWHYNEPFADSSALPSFALCEMTRRFVTVALNGDGGDEAHLGYERYLGTLAAEWYDVLPEPVRRSVLGITRLIPSGAPKSGAYRLRRFAEALAQPPVSRYSKWITFFDGSMKAELYAPEFAAQVGRHDSLLLLEEAQKASDAPTFVEAVAHADVKLYLPDDLLVKMDIASMAHSLEVRSPFLDHKVMEFAARLPASLKLRGFTQKYLLKRVMRDCLPPRILGRRKMGFGVPIDRWFREEMREMAYDVLLDARARQRGYFRAEVVQRYLDQHVRGDAHHHFRLWNLLMLELWHRMFVDQRCPASSPDRL